MFQVAVANVIGNIVFGQRYEYDDPNFQAFMASLDAVMNVIGSVEVLALFPQFKHLPCDPFHFRHLMSCLARSDKLQQDILDLQR